MKIKKLPKKAKVAATHALSELDVSIRNIADILGIGTTSVVRYLKEEPEEKWLQFGKGIKRLFSVKEEEIAAKTLALIEEKIPRAQFRELVGLYKIIRELQQPRAGLVQQQFNIELPSWSK